jgi:O-antigen/teichoic acid export membrane protein
LEPDSFAPSTDLDRRKYLGHFLIIATGNGAAQAINLLAYPVLARLYSPHEFGLFSMFVAAAAVPGMVACGRFEFAIPIAPKWGVSSVLWLCFLISTAIGIVSTCGAAIYSWSSSASEGSAFALVLGICVFLTGVCAAGSYFLMRYEAYRVASLSIAVRTVSAVGSQIVLAFVSSDATSLIVGFTLGLVAQAILLVVVIRRRLNLGRPRWRPIRAMLLRFRSQVSVDFPSTLVGAIALSVLTFALAILYDARTVGFYSIGNRLAVVPLALFNDSLAQVFFQRASRAKEQKGHLWDELKFSLLTAGLLSMGVLVVIVLLAHPFIEIFLGTTWTPAAEMLVVLAPMLAVRSLSMSIATTVFVLRSAHWLFVHNVMTVALPVLAFSIAAIFHLNAIAFLEIASALLFVEYALFGTFLVVAVRRDRSASNA